MRYIITAIKDKKVGFLNPMTDYNEATAVRNFEHAFADKASMYATHKDDFQLFKIAEFDTDSGIISALAPAEFKLLVDGATLV